MRALSVRLPIGATAVAAGLAAAALAILGSASDPTLALALLGGIAALLLGWSRPMTCVYLAILLIPLEFAGFPVSITSGHSTSFRPAEVLFLAAAVGWLLRQLGSGQPLLSSSRLNRSLGLLVLAVLPGLALAADKYAVTRQLVAWGAFFLVFQMIARDGDARTVRQILIALAISGGVLGATAVLQWNGGTHQLVDFGYQTTGRATATLSQPNLLGILLVVAISGEVALLLAGPRRLRAIALVLLALSFGGVLVTLSRGAFIGLAGGIGVLLFWAPFRRVATVFFIVFLALSWAGADPLRTVVPEQNVVQRLSTLGSAGAIDQRGALYQTEPRIFADHPIFGVGANNLGEVAPAYGLIDPIGGKPLAYAHNIELGVAVELGLVGLVGLLWFALSLAGVLVRACARCTGESRAYAFALTAAFFAVALEGLVDNVLGVAAFAGTLFVLAGCAAVLERSVRLADGARPIRVSKGPSGAAQ